MNSVVLELQRNALDRGTPVSDLLRKALVVARKLSLEDIQQWIDRELNGYPPEVAAPDYREVRGQVRSWNPYRGWVPVIFDDPDLGEAASKRRCGQSIAQLEHLSQQATGALHMPFSQAVQRSLSEDTDFETEFTLFVSQSSLIGIVDAVRTVVLNWALKLEEGGVLGEGLAFTPEERRAAVNSPQNINNFYGPVHGAQIQQGNPSAVQVSATTMPDDRILRALLEELKAKLDALELSAEDRGELDAEVRTAQAQIDSPKPKAVIVRECLKSVRSILEKAAGTIVGKALLDGVDKLR